MLKNNKVRQNSELMSGYKVNYQLSAGAAPPVSEPNHSMMD